jgi:hypothetical protein
MLSTEDALRPRAEVANVALSGDGKAFDMNPVYLFKARRKLIPPREIVSRARGQHADLEARRQPLGDVPSV